MSKTLEKLLKIKTEAREFTEFNQFRLGLDTLDESYESSSNQDEFFQQKKTSNNHEQTRKKLQQSQNKLKTINYKNKLRQAYALLTRNKLIKENKSLKRDISKLKQKLQRFNEFTGSINKLCVNYCDLNPNNKNNSSACASNSEFNRNQVI